MPELPLFLLFIPLLSRFVGRASGADPRWRWEKGAFQGLGRHLLRPRGDAHPGAGTGASGRAETRECGHGAGKDNLLWACTTAIIFFLPGTKRQSKGIQTMTTRFMDEQSTFKEK